MPRQPTKNPTKSTSATKATPTIRLRAQLRIFLDEEIALGPGKVDLLEAIRDTGSISGAGKQMGMSYRRAWLLVDTMNRCFQEPLVETAKGGSHGGGAQITPHGAEILRLYRELQSEVNAVTESHFQSLAPFLRKSRCLRPK